ncbi:MAG TPA: DUF502 domain-containing protein [Geminicoccaceae bacterium]|nr:DUF502 domain-containing protein [Geminicoccaceae bacterium]
MRRRKQPKPRNPTTVGPILVEPGKPGRFSLLARLRTYFLTGVIVTAPLAITFYLVWQTVGFIDDRVTGWIPDRYNPETYLPFTVPGLGLLVMLVLLTLIGMLAAGFIGRALVRFGERLLARMPIIRSIYGALKQIFETVLAQSSRSFREVVLVEYPRRDLWAIGFVTGPTKGEVQDQTPDDMVNVFLPTTPNPTSGFLLFVPRHDLIHLNMTIEEGIKLVISGGIVSPPRPWEEKPGAQPEPAPAPGPVPEPVPVAAARAHPAPEPEPQPTAQAQPVAAARPRSQPQPPPHGRPARAGAV